MASINLDDLMVTSGHLFISGLERVCLNFNAFIYWLILVEYEVKSSICENSEGWSEHLQISWVWWIAMNNRKIRSIFTNKLFVCRGQWEFLGSGSMIPYKEHLRPWWTSDFNMFQLLPCTRYQYRNEFSRVLSLGRIHTIAAYIWGRPSLLTSPSGLLGAKELWGDTGPNRLPSLAALIPREVEQTYWPRRAVACVSFTGDKNDGTKKPGVKGKWCFFEGEMAGLCDSKDWSTNSTDLWPG